MIRDFRVRWAIARVRLRPGKVFYFYLDFYLYFVLFSLFTLTLYFYFRFVEILLLIFTLIFLEKLLLYTFTLSDRKYFVFEVFYDVLGFKILILI